MLLKLAVALTAVHFIVLEEMQKVFANRSFAFLFFVFGTLSADCDAFVSTCVLGLPSPVTGATSSRSATCSLWFVLGVSMMVIMGDYGSSEGMIRRLGRSQKTGAFGGHSIH